LPGGIGAEGVAGLGFASGLDGEQVAGQIFDGAFGMFFGLGPARSSESIELWAGFSGSDIFSDEVGFGDGNEQLWGGLLGVGGGELDDETFLAGILGDCGIGDGGTFGTLWGKDLKAEVFTDPMLQVDDIVAGFELGEADFGEGLADDGLSGLETARALDLVAAEDFCIGDDDSFDGVAEEATTERGNTRMQPGGIGGRLGEIGGWGVETFFAPDFMETLAFAIVVAEDLDEETLA